MYDRQYVSALEDLIMDELMPMYIIGCRASGTDPRAATILKKLLEAKQLQKEIPWLLKRMA